MDTYKFCVREALVERNDVIESADLLRSQGD